MTPLRWHAFWSTMRRNFAAVRDHYVNSGDIHGALWCHRRVLFCARRSLIAAANCAAVVIAAHRKGGAL